MTTNDVLRYVIVSVKGAGSPSLLTVELTSDYSVSND